MKTTLRFLIAACLLLVLSSGALAQMPLFFGDFASYSLTGMFEAMLNIYDPGERLFSTDELDSHLELQGYFGVDDMEGTIVTAEYYLNDFVYGKLFYQDESEITILGGGYLWEDLGVFVAVDYLSASSDAYILTGGYRFDLGGGGYAALSLDYYGGDYFEQFAGEAAVKYLADGLKISGQLYVTEDGDFALHGKANVAAGDNLVWGGGLTYIDDGGYYNVFAGLTWDAASGLFDALVDVDDEGYFLYYLSYLHSFSDALALGLSYMDGDMMGDDLVALKGQYQLGGGELSFSYATSADDDGGLVGLGYEMSF